VGERINTECVRSPSFDRLVRDQMRNVRLDLKRRIQGDSHIIEEDETRIVLGNRACPFGMLVAGRPSLCMMTSNVFGCITAQNLGSARVDIQESIARGHVGCRSVINLTPTDQTGVTPARVAGSRNDRSESAFRNGARV
jgi:hypothetical protein